LLSASQIAVGGAAVVPADGRHWPLWPALAALVASGAAVCVSPVDAASDFVSAGASAPIPEDFYVYTTKDVAVDLASPLVAYRLVTAALRQEIPLWLDALIAAFVLLAGYAVFTDAGFLDQYLV
jgi:hypothetical protein